MGEKRQMYAALHLLFRAGAVQQAAASYYGIARFLSIISCTFMRGDTPIGHPPPPFCGSALGRGGGGGLPPPPPSLKLPVCQHKSEQTASHAQFEVRVNPWEKIENIGQNSYFVTKIEMQNSNDYRWHSENSFSALSTRKTLLRLLRFIHPIFHKLNFAL